MTMSNAHLTNECESTGRCHGWSCVSCAGCGIIAPCAREDCPSCGQDPEILREATARRAREVALAANGEDIRLPALPALPTAT
jgi:hypothetical protein